MKRAIAYARFSSDLQREESIDAQLRAIRKYCDENGFVLLATYKDRIEVYMNLISDYVVKEVIKQ